MTSARLATLLVAVVVACLASSSLLAFSGRVAPWEEVADAEGPPRRLAEAVVRSEGYAATMTMARDMADEVFGDANGPQSRALSIARPVREDAAARAVRHLYQQMLGSGLGGRDSVSFSECQGRLIKHCKTIVKRYLRQNGLLRGPQRIDIQVHRKRSKSRAPSDAESNKVVIVTDALGSAVIDVPRYPQAWTWNGRTIGPWPSCVGQAPEVCCLAIKTDVPDQDGGKSIECQFFNVALTNADGIRYPRVRDEDGNPINGIIMYRSVDATGKARVEETPFIQADFNLPFNGGDGGGGGGGGRGGGRRQGDDVVVDDDYDDDDYEDDDDDNPTPTQ